MLEKVYDIKLLKYYLYICIYIYFIRTLWVILQSECEEGSSDSGVGLSESTRGSSESTRRKVLTKRSPSFKTNIQGNQQTLWELRKSPCHFFQLFLVLMTKIIYKFKSSMSIERRWNINLIWIPNSDFPKLLYSFLNWYDSSFLCL